MLLNLQMLMSAVHLEVTHATGGVQLFRTRSAVTNALATQGSLEMDRLVQVSADEFCKSSFKWL